MIWLAATAAVHTTGVNWASVTAIVSGVVVALAIIIGGFAKWISNQITGAIDRFSLKQSEIVAGLTGRVIRVETKIDAMRRDNKRD